MAGTEIAYRVAERGTHSSWTAGRLRAGSEPRLDRMACFWSLPEAVRARAGAKLTPCGSPGGRERVRGAGHHGPFGQNNSPRAGGDLGA